MTTKQDVARNFKVYFPFGDPIDVQYFFSPWFTWKCVIDLQEQVEFEIDIPKKIFKAIYLKERCRKLLLEECHNKGLVRRRPKGFRTPKGTLIRYTNYGWKLERIKGPYRLTIDLADDSIGLFALNIQWPHIFMREVLNGIPERPRFYWTNSCYELINSRVPLSYSGTILFVNRKEPEDLDDLRSYSLIIRFADSFSSQADSWLIERQQIQE
jgi:hypothetical protein